MLYVRKFSLARTCLMKVPLIYAQNTYLLQFYRFYNEGGIFMFSGDTLLQIFDIDKVLCQYSPIVLYRRTSSITACRYGRSFLSSRQMHLPAPTTLRYYLQVKNVVDIKDIDETKYFPVLHSAYANQYAFIRAKR